MLTGTQQIGIASDSNQCHPASQAETLPLGDSREDWTPIGMRR